MNEQDIIASLDSRSTVDKLLRHNKAASTVVSWILLAVSSVFFAVSAFALYHSVKYRRSRAAIPIGLYMLVVLVMLMLDLLAAVYEAHGLVKKSTRTTTDWIHFLIPMGLALIAFGVLSFQIYRFFCLNKSTAKLSKTLVVFKLAVAAAVVWQSFVQINGLKKKSIASDAYTRLSSIALLFLGAF